eukprot:UN28041
MAQSPINLSELSNKNLDETGFNIEFFYKDCRTTVKNNGHTVMWEIDGDGGHILVDGIEYKLAQFHYHMPSEHILVPDQDKEKTLEIHFVHICKNTHQLVLVGVIVKLDDKGHDFLDHVSVHLPLKKDETANQVLKLSDINFSDTYYYYNGSMTMPPCTQGVLWFVDQNIHHMNQNQYDIFFQSLHLPFNNRPMQPSHDRTVKICQGIDKSKIFQTEK